MGVNVSIPNYKKRIKSLFPKDFKLENSTIWSFKQRGSWATHNGNYRGNWSPYIPRNLILRYSKENDLVLDYFCGAGTTGVECKLLNRNFIGVDINPSAIQLAEENANFPTENLFKDFKTGIEFKVGDARDLSFLDNESIDLICAHPPYTNIIQYTHDNINDLSHLNIREFLIEIHKVALESHRVLKEGKHCTILIGDMRKNKHVIPLGFRTIKEFTKAGFTIKELIIKRQHNCKTTGFWYNNSIKYNFLLLAHEYLVTFQKAEKSMVITNHIPNDNKYKDIQLSKSEYNRQISIESSSVWIFNENNWLNNTIANLTERYSKKNFNLFDIDKKHDVNYDLIIKMSPNLLNECLKFAKFRLLNDGILAVICEDIRLKDGTVYPSAIGINSLVDELKEFKIKEIVIISIENSGQKKYRNELEINHKYILIYRKVP
ncbi:MAG: methyltransferase domain-containing protein [candidate division Zixibacteria bacterium]|nr:methyltransferase domain-containing protein [Candidatus Tariuqbacter arcticus]